jgi:hypothetical protein
MAVTYVETRVKGKNFQVPAAEIEGRTVIVRGRWFKIASVRDEDVTEGELVRDPEAFVADLRKSGLVADILTFFQRLPDVKPKFSYHMELENYAVVPITTFEAWWENLPQETRKNTRRAARRGVIVKVVPFDDELARGIHEICNESPVRNGRRFWHYGKDFETVKREHATYLERSEFIGAYFEDQLIGFIKLVYVDRLAYILSIVALNAHQDKRPMNALVAKAVEVCAQKRVGWFVYGNYVYGNKKDDSLAEFKRRNGFERMDLPRYYLPLTWKGRLFTSLKLYRGAVGLLPWPVLQPLLKSRKLLLEVGAKPSKACGGS